MSMQAASVRSVARAIATKSRPASRGLLNSRVLSRPLSSTLTKPEPALAPPVQPRPPGNGNRWRSFLQNVGRVTLVSILTAGGVFVYVTQKDKHPGPQQDFDPEKKTVVVLGSGWGATNLLKTIDTDDYNVIVISPKNYFLFTPLLPSVAVGTVSPRSIIQPTRYVTRHKSRKVSVIEAEATEVDPFAKTVTFADESEIQGKVTQKTIPYDYLIYAVGAENQDFGIPGVRQHGCFMKELKDAEKLQRRFMDCVETAAFPGQDEEEIDRLLHVVVVGGGPTGVEVAGELHDFMEEDLRSWYPELAGRVRLTLVEALPSVLPMFSKQLIDYTVSTFKESKISIMTKTMVKEVTENSVKLQMPDGSMQEVPCGILVWCGGNRGLTVTRDLMAKLPDFQTNRRGITVDDYLKMKGIDSIYAIGDCTSTAYAPTAQVASQQGAYLGRILKQIAKRDQLQQEADVLGKEITVEGGEDGRQEQYDKLQKQLEKASRLRPFHYSHQGSLAYIGSERAIADLPIFNGNYASGGVATYLFWRSAYISTLFSLRNRTLVATDWLKVKLFGRDVSRE